jgi:hypothetical protein
MGEMANVVVVLVGDDRWTDLCMTILEIWRREMERKRKRKRERRERE